ncbi:DNA-binding NarL/FixJ family response regulator [Nocardioides thalensis]|uniref:DNA-binding NarL/FixJ family response regulator n=1 Tax=Nocardioides thalensis TaxID=1914755 RepID=A0A853C0T2_9ACTN|nr:LuxR C-terminal-related transcriptional regulator [Nocardioides thalensis]NYJ00854.1 DNA-binding NarL/FixJ family response regulator [Nocardioides thalensis]
MGLETARAAFAARTWPEARTAYAACDALAARDLEQWGLAAFLTGHLAEAADARQRAHHAYLAEGDLDGASRVAFWLGLTATFRGEPAQARGWWGLMRSVQGERFDESVWRGYELLTAAMGSLLAGRAEAALALAAEVTDIATAHDDPDLRVLAGNAHGQALLASGDLAAGLAELDATMLLATATPVSPQAVGIVYCAIVANCKACLDVERSAEWTGVLDEWCAAQPGLVPFQGACIVHRSEVHQLRGDWGRAIEEVDDLIAHPGPNANTVGEAHYLRAELHRLRGEHDAAETAYRDALARGKDPQPGLALMRARQGRTDSALAALTRALEEPRPQQLKTGLWRALVDVALAAGDLACAADAAARLDALAAASDARFLRAAAAMARGQVALRAGNPQEALGPLRDALDGFAGAGSPYDVARCRVAIAAACDAFGDRETARLERDAARETFRALDARPDIDELDGTTRDERHGLTAREVEILRLVASGATNRGIADELVLSEKTVARHLANVFAKLDVSNRAAATTWAHRHGLS